MRTGIVSAVGYQLVRALSQLDPREPLQKALDAFCAILAALSVLISTAPRPDLDLFLRRSYKIRMLRFPVRHFHLIFRCVALGLVPLPIGGGNVTEPWPRRADTIRIAFFAPLLLHLQDFLV